MSARVPAAPAPAGWSLGRRLLARELEGAPERGANGDRAAGPVALAAAAERALQKLGRPLGRLVGVDGYRALLKRALHLARGRHPLLRDVRLRDAQTGTPPAPGAQPAGSLEGLATALQGADPARAGDALAAVLTHVIGLLVTFIGSDLTTRTLREVWPDVPAGPDAPDAPDVLEVADAHSDAKNLGGGTGAAPVEASP